MRERNEPPPIPVQPLGYAEESPNPWKFLPPLLGIMSVIYYTLQLVDTAIGLSPLAEPDLGLQLHRLYVFASLACIAPYLAGIIFGLLGIWRLPGARIGMFISALASLAGQAVYLVWGLFAARQWANGNTLLCLRYVVAYLEEPSVFPLLLVLLLPRRIMREAFMRPTSP